MLNLLKVKQEICDIGQRIYNRGYAAANDGNISFRISEKEVVCTPTQICKGFMKPDDLCIVDMEGKQLAGKRPRTSEVLLHLAIMKARPEVKSVVHCHPPYATAFGVAREPVPTCILPEADIFIGDVPITKYAIPGGQDFADTILPFIHQANVIILANHGTVSFGETVEKAFWWTEILDSYCRILMLAKDLGRVHQITGEEARDLIKLKEKWGKTDPRSSLQNCDLCANDVFRDSWKDSGVGHYAFQPSSCSDDSVGANIVDPDPAAHAMGETPEVEALVKAITDRVMDALKKQ
ncbi:MAG: class II aldolase/adducin family protein [Thermoguttaceae bacterium]|nr:class II aldolase/adducin family protein [Thermoguttaceae bacterium]